MLWNRFTQAACLKNLSSSMGTPRRNLTVLVIAEGILPPATSVAGTKAIYETCELLTRTGVNLRLLTSTYPNVQNDWRKWVESQSSRNLRFHVVKVPAWAKSDALGFLFSKPQLLLYGLYLALRYRFDIVHEYSSSPIMAIFTGLYRIVSRAKTIHTLCTYNKGILGSMRWSVLWILLNTAIVSSRHMSTTIRGNARKKVAILPLGVDLAAFSGRTSVTDTKPELFQNDPRTKVLYLGPLTARKGIGVFADVADDVTKARQDVVFLVATYRESPFDPRHNDAIVWLQNRFSKNPSFQLLTGNHHVPDLMTNADIVIWPQTEPFGTIAYPLTILEGMAAGTSIVASDLPNIKDDLITPGQNGLVFTPGDSGSLKDRLTDLLDDQTLRQKLSEQAQHDVSRFDLNHTVAELRTLYETTVHSGIPEDDEQSSFS
jgi:glycosyltransferase involved in cell wall biosynthesis